MTHRYLGASASDSQAILYSDRGPTVWKYALHVDPSLHMHIEEDGEALDPLARYLGDINRHDTAGELPDACLDSKKVSPTTISGHVHFR